MSEIKNTKKNVRDRSQKLKDPESMFDEVNENTSRLIINYIIPKRAHQNIATMKLYPDSVIINLYDYTSRSLNDLRKLPNEMPHLKTLSLLDTQISNINQLPKKLPSLQTFVIHDSFWTSSKGTLKSLKGLPNNLPSLEIFGVQNCLIHTLEYIPSSLPKLKKFSVKGCPLYNLRNFPKNIPNLEELHLGGNQLTSLEGLPSELPKIKKINLIGNNLASLKYFPQKINNYARIDFDHNLLRSLCYLNNDLLSKVIHRHKIFKQYKEFDLGPRFEEFLTQYLVPYETVNENTGETEIGQKYNMHIIEQIQNYYRKTTTELIQQYISDSESVSKDELERIIWEADVQDRNALEANFSSNNDMIQKITKRLKFDLPSGHSIFK
ncbi:MAG: leucine-rich repeat domain-containing protein [Promethearchaeota archaeon]